MRRCAAYISFPKHLILRGENFMNTLIGILCLLILFAMVSYVVYGAWHYFVVYKRDIREHKSNNSNYTSVFVVASLPIILCVCCVQFGLW